MTGKPILTITATDIKGDAKVSVDWKSGSSDPVVVANNMSGRQVTPAHKEDNNSLNITITVSNE